MALKGTVSRLDSLYRPLQTSTDLYSLLYRPLQTSTDLYRDLVPGPLQTALRLVAYTDEQTSSSCTDYSLHRGPR